MEVMFEQWNIGVVIPAKNEEKHIRNVINTLPSFVDKYVLVNDGSTDNTVDESGAKNVIHLDGEGVGAAIDAGHRWMLESMEKPFISVVMAGDGQMNPLEMETLLLPIIQKRCSHVKGDRSSHQTGLGKMPFIRKFGTFLLSFIMSLGCGRTVKDPQCGYTATSNELLEQWDWTNSWKGYGYPNWWLLKLTHDKKNFESVPVESIYRNEHSGLKISSFFSKVAPMMFFALHRRSKDWIKEDMETMQSIWGIPTGMFYIGGWGSLLLNILTLGEFFWSFIGVQILCWLIAHGFDRLWVKSKIMEKGV